MALRSQPDRTRSIAEITAYLGRYAKQPWTAIKDMPMSFVYALMDATGQLLKDEAPKE